MNLHVVKYTGPQGFIKPWCAVRDCLTYSQKFVSPSTLNGIEQKLFPELLGQKKCNKIHRYKLSPMQDLDSIPTSIQQETTKAKKGEATSIINRGVIINPVFYLAFTNKEDAEIASKQHICLCRNEDVLLPEHVQEMTEEKFDNIPGFETKEDKSGVIVGFDRYNDFKEMRVEIIVK